MVALMGIAVGAINNEDAGNWEFWDSGDCINPEYFNPCYGNTTGWTFDSTKENYTESGVL